MPLLLSLTVPDCPHCFADASQVMKMSITWNDFDSPRFFGHCRVCFRYVRVPDTPPVEDRRVADRRRADALRQLPNPRTDPNTLDR